MSKNPRSNHKFGASAEATASPPHPQLEQIKRGLFPNLPEATVASQTPPRFADLFERFARKSD